MIYLSLNRKSNILMNQCMLDKNMGMVDKFSWIYHHKKMLNIYIVQLINNDELMMNRWNKMDMIHRWYMSKSKMYIELYLIQNITDYYIYKLLKLKFFVMDYCKLYIQCKKYKKHIKLGRIDIQFHWYNKSKSINIDYEY